MSASAYTIVLRFRSGLCVGGGQGHSAADKSSIRDLSGAPYIPASTLKGGLRIELERLLSGLKVPVCRAVAAGGQGAQAGLCPSGQECVACRLFGGKRYAAKLRIGDAVLRRGPLEPLAGRASFALRPSVSLSRALRRAAPERYFSREAVDPALHSVFNASVRLRAGLDAVELEALTAACEALAFLGGEKSRGLGRVEAELVACDVAGQPVYAGTGRLRKLTLTCRQPVRISHAAGKHRNFYETLDHLPGSTVRGAVAAAMAELPGVGPDSAVFREAFVESPIRFSDFTTDGALPFPSTARTCKIYPGHRAVEGDERTRTDGVIDLAVVGLLAKYDSAFEIPENCSRCLDAFSPLVPRHGRYKLAGGSGDFEAEASPAQTVVTKVGLSRELLRASASLLYSYQILEPEENRRDENDPGGFVRFAGAIGPISENLCTALSRIREVFVGGGASRGFGRAQLDWDAPNERSVEKAAARFDSVVRRLWREAHKGAANDPEPEWLVDRRFACLDLTSPLRLPAAPADLDGWFASLFDGLAVKLETASLAMTIRGGWDAAAGLPKELAHLPGPGTVLVFSYAAADSAAMLARLTVLEREGAGLQRHEGFGGIEVCSDFHVERVTQQ